MPCMFVCFLAKKSKLQVELLSKESKQLRQQSEVYKANYIGYKKRFEENKAASQHKQVLVQNNFKLQAENKSLLENVAKLKEHNENKTKRITQLIKEKKDQEIAFEDCRQK